MKIRILQAGRYVRWYERAERFIKPAITLSVAAGTLIGYFILRKGEKGMQVPSTGTSNKVLESVVLSESLSWFDLFDLPDDVYFKTEKYICVDYDAVKDFNLFLDWVRRCETAAAAAGASVLKIALFAKFDRLRAGEPARVATLMKDYAATIIDYKEASFDEAFHNFDRQLVSDNLFVDDYQNYDDVEVAGSHRVAETVAEAGAA